MAKTVAAFYELPPWVEKMNQLQRQMDSLMRPLGEFQTDYAALTKTVAAALDSPAIRDLNRISRVFDSQSMAAIYRTQEIVAKMDTSGIAAALHGCFCPFLLNKMCEGLCLFGHPQKSNLRANS